MSKGIRTMPRGLYAAPVVAGSPPASDVHGHNDAAWFMLGIAVLIVLVFPWKFELEEKAQLGHERESAVIGGAA